MLFSIAKGSKVFRTVEVALFALDVDPEEDILDLVESISDSCEELSDGSYEISSCDLTALIERLKELVDEANTEYGGDLSSFGQEFALDINGKRFTEF